jgi:DNA-binding Xre family transcriptional regulator
MNMLVFNLNRILTLRGIENRFAFLTRIGFHRTIANNLANDRVANIKIAHLEKLCRALNCEPSDLFEWKPAAGDTLVESHSLKSLVRGKSAPPLNQIVRDIPVKNLDKIEGLLNQLRDEDQD